MSRFSIAGSVTAFDAPMVSAESTCEITLDDLHTYAKQLPGMRLTLEHMHPMHASAQGRTITCGQVTKANVDAARVCLCIEADIDGDEKGERVRKRINDKLLRGFSVGLDNSLNLATGQHNKRLEEISITAEPEVPTAVIENVREIRAYSSRKMDPETRQKVDELIAEVAALDQQETTLRIISASSLLAPEKTKPATQESESAKTQEKEQNMSSSQHDAFERGYLAGQNKEMLAGQRALAAGNAAVSQPPFNTPMPVQIQPPVAVATSNFTAEMTAEYEARINKIIDDRFKLAQQQQLKEAEEARTAELAAARPAPRTAGSKRTASRAAEAEEVDVDPQPEPDAPKAASDYAKLLQKNKELEARLHKAMAAKATPVTEADLEDIDETRDDLDLDIVPEAPIETPAIDADVDDNDAVPLAPKAPSQKALNKLAADKESVIAMKRTIKQLKDKLKDTSLSEEEKSDQLNEINEQSKACQALGAKYVADAFSVISKTYTSSNKQTPPGIMGDFAKWKTMPEVTSGVVHQVDKYVQMVSASSGAAQQTLAMVQAQMKKLKADNELKNMQLREKEDMLKQKTEHAAARTAARTADPKTSAAAMQQLAIDQTRVPMPVAVPAAPAVNAMHAVYGDILALKPKNPTVCGQSETYAGYDAVTRLPVGKKDEDLTFTEITGIPLVPTDSNVSVLAAANQRGFQNGWRQEPQSALRTSDKCIEHGATQGMRVLKGIHRTGNAEFIASVTPNLLRAGTEALELFVEQGVKMPKSVRGGKEMTNGKGHKFILLPSASSTMVPKNLDWYNDN